MYDLIIIFNTQSLQHSSASATHPYFPFNPYPYGIIKDIIHTKNSNKLLILSQNRTPENIGGMRLNARFETDLRYY